jgi:hypothetical protein
MAVKGPGGSRSFGFGLHLTSLATTCRGEAPIVDGSRDALDGAIPLG